jgi:photosystem II stability/assembly factor-like uncharacterized protein
VYKETIQKQNGKPSAENSLLSAFSNNKHCEGRTMKRMNKPFGLQVISLSLFLLFSSVIVSAQNGWMPSKKGEDGKDLTAVYFIDSKRGFIGGEDGFLSSTNDGGLTWQRLNAGAENTINDIYFRNKENGFFVSGNRIFSTTDSGQTWRESHAFRAADFDGATPELYSIRFGSKKTGWIVGSLLKHSKTEDTEIVVDSLLLYTDDGGTTWNRRGLPTKNELVHLDFVSDERGWVVGANGTILYTEDGGLSWTVQRSGTDRMLNNVEFRDKKKGWAVGQKGILLRTTDGGETWTTTQTPASGALYSVKFISDDIGWIAGRDGVVLLSNDGGRTWIQQDSKTKQNIYALFVDKKNGWAVGGDGMLLIYGK